MLTWIFDLDNTLHDASPHIFPHINQSMTAYLQRYLALEEAEAAALRVRYWKQYGATLLGLVRHHGTDPMHFLWHTHQFGSGLADLRRMVIADRAALAALHRLPGRKLVFSNSPGHYARAVLQILGIARLFDAVYSIERVRFAPKPAHSGFRRLLAAERLVPHRTVMVDDMLANLYAAKRLGLRTVWVNRAPRAPRYVDVRVHSVRQLPRFLDELGAGGPR